METNSFFHNHLCRSWKVVVPGAHKRLPNGIVGLLCREHFPGMVHYNEKYEPATTYEHYLAADDAQDATGHTYDSVAERIMHEFYVNHPRTTLLNTLHSLGFLELVY